MIVLGADEGPSGPTGALPAAILALNPLHYCTLRGNDANTLKDWGSLADNLTNISAGMTLNSRAGSDGFSYPVQGSSGRFDAVDDIAYEPLNASGLTIGFMFDPVSSQAGLGIYICKFQNSGAGTFRISIETSSGIIRVQTTTSAPGDARRRQATVASLASGGGWSFVIVRLGGAGSDFPGIRVEGVNQTGTTTGSGSTNSNSAAPYRLWGHDGASTSPGSMAHEFVAAGQLSDGQCSTLESAAASDGW